MYTCDGHVHVLRLQCVGPIGTLTKLYIHRHVPCIVIKEGVEMSQLRGRGGDTKEHSSTVLLIFTVSLNGPA